MPNSSNRPETNSIVGVFWASDSNGHWVRRARTWTLPWLINIYGHRYAFKYIYAAWCQMPIALPTHQRGKDVPSRRGGRMLEYNKWIAEAKSFVELAGVPKPSAKEEWSMVFKEIGIFNATKAFVVRNPPCVMQMQVQSVRCSSGPGATRGLPCPGHPCEDPGIHPGWSHPRHQGQLEVQCSPRLGC